MKPFDTVLAAVDFSKNSDYAFSHAVTIAKMFSSRIIVLHVIDNSVDAHGFYIPHPSIDLLVKEQEESTRLMMTKYCESNLADFSNHTATILKGLPYSMIIKTAERRNVSLIVLGTHGRTGIDRLVFGSTAERVVRGAPCPVLTVPLAK